MADSSIDYRVAGLRDARDQHITAAAAAAAVAEALDRPGLEAGIFGAVPAAAGFHTSTADVVRRRRADARAESTRRAELGDRTDRALGLGVRLIVDTSTIARSVSAVDADIAAR